MALTIEELKEKLIAEYDPDDILSELEISTEELLDAFEDKLIDKSFRFEEFDSETEEEEI